MGGLVRDDLEVHSHLDQLYGLYTGALRRFLRAYAQYVECIHKLCHPNVQRLWTRGMHPSHRLARGQSGIPSKAFGSSSGICGHGGGGGRGMKEDR